MQVRAANIVRAGESLMKLVSDIKQYLILNDFHSVNEAITANSQLFRQTQNDCDKKLMKLRDDMAADLYDLEEEYYTSVFKWIFLWFYFLSPRWQWTKLKISKEISSFQTDPKNQGKEKGKFNQKPKKSSRFNQFELRWIVYYKK